MTLVKLDCPAQFKQRLLHSAQHCQFDLQETTSRWDQASALTYARLRAAVSFIVLRNPLPEAE